MRVYNFSCPPIEAYEANGFVVHNCAFCAFRSGEREWFGEGGTMNPNRRLAFDKVLEVLDDCAELGVKGIELTGGGEPTIHPQFAQVVERINALGFKWGIVTNGVRMQDLSTASWARVSLDAGTPETYSKLRRVEPEMFEKALATIKRWRPGVSFVVTDLNWREIYDAAVLVKSLGASNVRIRAYYSDAGVAVYDGFAGEALELARRAEGLADSGFEVHNQVERDLTVIKKSHEGARCYYQNFTTWIAPDLNVYRCCLTSYTEKGRIGSIRNRRFADLWRESAVRFGEFDARACIDCRYGDINKAVAEVFEPDPSEVFI